MVSVYKGHDITQNRKADWKMDQKSLENGFELKDVSEDTLRYHTYFFHHNQK